MFKVKFISYSGRYPNLCSGILKLEIEGKEVSFPKHFIISGGNIERNDDWDMWANYGDWSISTTIKDYDFTDEIIEEIIKVINENIPHGCCGGCI